MPAADVKGSAVDIRAAAQATGFRLFLKDEDV